MPRACLERLFSLCKILLVFMGHGNQAQVVQRYTDGGMRFRCSECVGSHPTCYQVGCRPPSYLEDILSLRTQAELFAMQIPPHAVKTIRALVEAADRNVEYRIRHGGPRPWGNMTPPAPFASRDQALIPACSSMTLPFTQPTRQPQALP